MMRGFKTNKLYYYKDTGGVLEDGALPRRVMTLFMLIDTSGSMLSDGNIGKVNRAVEETVQQLRDVSDSNFDAEIRIAILEFSSGCRWVTNGAESFDNFIWNDLNAGGVTDMGAAFVELESKLSRAQFLQSSTGAYAPVIILLSDGQPTDDIDVGIEKLRHNNWYKSAMKIAIAVTSDAADALIKFTGSTETVIPYDSNKQDLCRLLTKLTVVSSKMQSRSRGASELGEAVDRGNVGDIEIAQQAAVEVVSEVINDDDGGWDDSGW